MTDAYLLRVAAGDRDAMRLCIERYSRLVWSLAMRLSPSRADAEDAVQEIFVALWQNAARYDATRATEATFITVLARRRLIDRIRRSGRTITSQVDAFDPDELAARSEDPTTNSEARRAARALGDLPEDRRRVVSLSVVEGMTQEEIAVETKLPLGTVKSHLRRGLLAVREALLGDTAAERRVSS